MPNSVGTPHHLDEDFPKPKEKSALDIAYEQTIIEVRIDKIQQKLFWYDNVPPDEHIVAYILEWRECRKRLKELGIKNRYTE